MAKRNNHVLNRCPSCKKKNKKREGICPYRGKDLRKNKRGHPNPKSMVMVCRR